MLEIERDPLTAYDYTAKANRVAVISNGTAILGLGDRGALDVRSRWINDPMKLASSHTLAALAREPVPQEVLKAYPRKRIIRGSDVGSACGSSGRHTKQLCPQADRS